VLLEEVRIACGDDGIACEEAGVPVKSSEDSFLFQVESYNNLSAAQQLKRAVKVLSQKCEDLEEFKV